MADDTERYSINEYPGDGSQTNWEISFAGGYINRDHVVASVINDEDGSEVDVEFTWVNDFTIQVTPAVADGFTLRIARETPVDAPIVDYTDNGIINETSLDISNKQAIFAAAEVRDLVVGLPDRTELLTIAANVSADAAAAAEARDYVVSISGDFALSSVLAGLGGAALIGAADGVTVQVRLDQVSSSLAAKANSNNPVLTGTATLNGFGLQTVNEKGAADGYAPLGPDGLVPSVNLPVNGSYKGTWDADTNTPTIVAGVGANGDTYIVAVAGTQSITGTPTAFGIGDQVRFTTNGNKWERIPNTSLVSSVAGKTGIVTLVKADVGLNNVDNTSDLAKPISTLTQSALNGKEPTITAGSAGQYWRGDKTFQTLDKAAVGLANVDNTSDANKPVSTAQASALANRVSGLTISQLLTYPTSQTAVWIKDAGREGLFVWNGSNLSAQVTADPGQGIYIASSVDTSGATGAWVRRFHGPVFPTWFGAVGDGSTSDQTAFSNMATYANANAGTEISLGAKTYRITGTVTFTNSTCMYGITAQISKVLCVGSAGLIFDGGSGSTVFFARQHQQRRIGFIQSGTNAAEPLLVTYTATSDTRGTIPGGALEDVEVSVENSSASWSNAIRLKDIPNIRVKRIRVEGARVSPLTCLRGIKVETNTGNGSSVDPIFEDYSCFFVRTCLDISGEVEGVNVDRALFVGVRRGVVWSNTAPGFQPSLWVHNSHINAEYNALLLENVVDLKIVGNEFFAQGADGTSTELNVIQASYSAAVGLRANIDISGNAFIGDLNYGEPSARASRAILISGNATAVENAIISRNFFQTYDAAITIGADVNGITVDDTNQFANCTTNVVNSAANGANIVAGRTVAGTHWQRVLNDGTIMKGGSLTVTLTSGGDGVIGLNGAGDNFPSALLPGAIVCNGDNGVAPDASFITQHGVSTSSLLYFSVRPNPGAVTVRVNYRAEGY